MDLRYQYQRYELRLQRPALLYQPPGDVDLMVRDEELPRTTERE